VWWLAVSDASRLALGTVQFGQDYGVANATGRVEPDEVGRMLDVARQEGIDTLDTGAEYGDAEAVLGGVGVGEWRIVTKLPASEPDGAGWVDRDLTASLERLRIERVYGLLVHRTHHLAEPGVLDGLLAARDAGLVRRVGASVYGPGDLDEWWDDRLDLVQVPYNVFDRRVVSSGWLERLASSGVEVHTRSAFLQGLLLMDEWPAGFDRWDGRRQAWRSWCDEAGVTPLEGALGTVLAEDRIDRVVVGVDGLAQLEEIVETASGDLLAAPQELATDDVNLIDPSRWG